MPEAEGFDSFARTYAGELLALARCLTIDAGESEQLVEDALLRVRRAEVSAQGDGSRLRTARRAVVRSHLRSRFGASLSLSRGAFEVTDRNPSAGADRPGDRVGPDRLAQALQDLPPRHLVVLALRIGRHLSRAETGGVLGWGSAAVHWMESRALHQVRLAADLDDEDARLKDRSHSESELWAGLRGAFSTRIPAEPDTALLLQRVAQRADRVHHLPPRPRVIVTGAGLLALVAVVAGSAAVQQRPSPASEDRVAGRLLAPAGSRLVGYRNIAVAVPSGWQLQGSSCGRIIVRGASQRHSSDIGPCASVGPASLTLADAPPNFPPLVVPPSRTRRVAGSLAQRSAVDRIQGGYSQTVFVFGAHFMMTVRSFDKAIVHAVVASMHPVPKGFTVVPNCESLPVRDAVATLEMVGLGSSIAHSLTLSTWHDEPPVIFQSKPSGSIVRRGTAVALTIPGR
jgi:DNA-directed RNA polymerase specialized sigma24 family protein